MEGQSSFSDEALAAARAQHGEVTELSASGVSVLVRAPSRGEYKRFRSDSFDAAKRSDAVERLCRACVVAPDAATFDRILDARPALADVFGARVLELAGATAEATAQKH
jgi:hypothetical protein